MNLLLDSWNGENLNDLVKFRSFIPLGQRSNLESSSVYTDRAQLFAKLSGSLLGGHYFTFKVSLLGVLGTNRELLKGICKIDDPIHHKLLAHDTADGNRVWYLSGMVKRVVEEKPGLMSVTIALDGPMWRVNVASTSVWNITATAQTKVLTLRGNNFTKPTIQIIPTGSRSGGFQYKRWIPLYNRIAAPFVNTPVELSGSTGLDTAALVGFTAISNQLNGPINAVVTTININVPVGGGLPVIGMGYVDTEQISWTGNSGTQLTGVVRGIGGTTAATHLTAAVVKMSKVQANLNDFRVGSDGKQIDRWIYNPNTTTTKAWANFSFSAGVFAGLNTAISGVGAVGSIVFVNTAAGRKAINALSLVKNKIVIIDSEAFRFTGVNKVTLTLTGCVRAQRGTTAAAHTANTLIYWVEHDVYVMYGNQLIGAQPTDDLYMPILDFTGSSHTLWKQVNFFDAGSVRPCRWFEDSTKKLFPNSKTYTGNQTALIDPSTKLGMTIAAYNSRGVWKSDTATMCWTINDPAGFTNVLYSGSKYAYILSSWIDFAGLQASSNGVDWTNIFDEPAPGVAATWTAFGPRNQALGATYSRVRFALVGTATNKPNNIQNLQMDTVSLTRDSARVPATSYGPEQVSPYYLDCTITNNNTTEAITVQYMMVLNAAIVIDCENKTIIYDGDAYIPGAIGFNTDRQDWFNLQAPSTAFATTTVQFDDPGTSGVQITWTWVDRSF